MTDEENQKYESNNIKIAVTAVLSVLLGAAFILAIIHFGMSVQQDIDAKIEVKKEKEKVVSIINVDYNSTLFGYTVSGGTMTREERDALPKNRLIEKIREGYDENYLVIDSQDLLDKVLDAIRSKSNDNSISYSVEKDFFSSGSVILVTSEEYGLSDIEIEAVSRDEENNIQIDASLRYDNVMNLADAKSGRAVLVKIRNIQPKSVEVKIIDDGPDK